MAFKRRVISDIHEILEYIIHEDSADDEIIESELSSENDFEVEDVNAPWKKQFYHKILFSALVFFLPIYNFVHCWRTYEWPCITVLVFIDYAPSLL